MNQWVGPMNRFIYNIYKTYKYRSESIIVYTKHKYDTKKQPCSILDKMSSYFKPQCAKYIKALCYAKFDTFQTILNL